LINDGGSIYKFDVSSRQFVSCHPNYGEIEEISIIDRQVLPASGPTRPNIPVLPRKHTLNTRR
jgi:hypothetical protein